MVEVNWSSENAKSTDFSKGIGFMLEFYNYLGRNGLVSQNDDFILFLWFFDTTKISILLWTVNVNNHGYFCYYIEMSNLERDVFSA